MKIDHIKEFAWKGRRYGEDDLFPCDALNIECQHKGRNLDLKLKSE